eukprot:8333624-Alexandrium_andersonii.AAC.1
MCIRDSASTARPSPANVPAQQGRRRGLASRPRRMYERSSTSGIPPMTPPGRGREVRQPGTARWPPAGIAHC